MAATAREEARTAQLAPVIHEMQCRDYSIHSIAVELGKRKVPTPRGWHMASATPAIYGATPHQIVPR